MKNKSLIGEFLEKCHAEESIETCVASEIIRRLQDIIKILENLKKA